MKSFETEIRTLISSVYSGEITDENLSSFPIIVLPDKKLAFHIIPIHPVNEQYTFADLSDVYQLRGIRLVHIWEDLWIQKRAIMESRIKLILGKFIRIHARQTKAQRIDAPTTDTFLNENHLYGSPAAKYKYGLYYNDKLVAAATFSGIRTYWRDGTPFRSAELVRFANLNGHSVAGGLSKMIACFVKEQQPDDIMSYADRDWSNGASYEKIGFQKTGYTLPQQFWIHPENLKRYYPQRSPEYMDELLKTPSGEKIAAHYLNDGYIPIFNAGNIKYLFFIQYNGGYWNK